MNLWFLTRKSNSFSQLKCYMDKNCNVESRMMIRHQLHAEFLRYEYCGEKPCTNACPVNCSPFEFMMEARVGYPLYIKPSAAEIMRNHPLGDVCGIVYPAQFCIFEKLSKCHSLPLNDRNQQTMRSK